MILICEIIVVVKEIESWYLAGLKEDCSKKLGIQKRIFETNTISKDKFLSMIKDEYKEWSISLQLEIINDTSLSQAMKLNNSLDYFIRKFNLQIKST